jgi:hypothetical protein
VGGSRHRGGQPLASLIAAAAGIGADLAVLVMVGVFRAFVATQLAGDDAGADLAQQEIPICFSLAAQDAAGRLADVGAVKIEADAAAQIFYIRLAQTGVGATGTRLGAGVARFNTADHRFQISLKMIPVGLQHFSNNHDYLQ